MMERLKETLNEIENYAIVPLEDGYSCIVFFVPYIPYDIIDNDKIFIDAYYEISNKIYKLTNKTIARLNAADYDAERYEGNDIKALAVKGGLAFYTPTTLVANEKYGTRIALGAIKIKGNYLMIHSCKSICSGCGACARSCPTEALDKGNLIRSKCIRELQSGRVEYSEAEAALMGNQVWGCDICQRVCSINFHLGFKEMDDNLSTLLDREHFIRSALNDRAEFNRLEPYLGQNYMKPLRLLSLAVNTAANMKDFRCIDIVDKLINHSDKRVRISAERLLREYNNRHNS